MTEKHYEHVKEVLKAAPKRWLVTGAAGFIGSNLVESLLKLGQEVKGLDNYATGSRKNVEDVMRSVPGAAGRFRMIEGDIRDQSTCDRACEGVDFVLHQAALGSVPRSVADPSTTNSVNVDGFICMVLAARDAGVSRFVYASSSSVYGDSTASPKREQDVGRPLSPYAVSKAVNESYAAVFSALYGIKTVGLRYFNVFGKRQDPEGPYAAVIPKWVARLLQGEECVVYGDGETTRDFCYVDNVVQANVLAALSEGPGASRVYNVACGEQASLNQLYETIRSGLSERIGRKLPEKPVYEDFRAGDIRASLADVSSARRELGYQPEYSMPAGMQKTLDWYAAGLRQGEKELASPAA